MATEAELAELGIVGSADVLPVRVGPKPQMLALPWAASMDDSDLSMFLDDLVSAAMGRWRSEPEVPDRTVLADIEKVCADWRTPGRGLRGDAPEDPPLTGRARLDASAARDAEATHWKRLGIEDPHDGPLAHSYRVPHDLPDVASLSVPETCHLDAAGLDEVSQHFLGGGAS